MKERPIIFSGEMVRAILDGRKTQTRRVMKGWYLNIVEEVLRINGKWVEDTLEYDLTSPYGRKGERLWLRETWGFSKKVDKNLQKKFLKQEFSPHTIHFRADNPDPGPIGFNWRSPFHIPRWVSRINLEITNIRVERLQDISEEDANKEGCSLPSKDQEWSQCRVWFRIFWNSLHKKDGFNWDKNPWVWVIEFRRVD